MDKQLKRLSTSIRRRAELAHRLLVPISGGTDSGLLHWLCNQALPGRVISVYVGSELRCRSWLESVGPVMIVPEIAGFSDKEAMRWAYFAQHARQENAWLVGARNWTEDKLGTYSLMSRVATYLPIVGVPKSVVMQLCTEIGVPEEMTASSRKADPDCGRPQELADVPLEIIDEYLFLKLGKLPAGYRASVTPEQVCYLDKIYNYTRFKENIPIRGPLCLPTW